MSDEKKPARRWNVYDKDVTNNNAQPEKFVKEWDDMIKQVMSHGAVNMLALMFNKMLNGKLSQIEDVSDNDEASDGVDDEEDEKDV